MRIFFCFFCFALTTISHAQEPVTDLGESSSHRPTGSVHREALAEQTASTLRDPTVPSQKILERLQPQLEPKSDPEKVSVAVPVSATVVPEPINLPTVHVKAIVLSDRDHGVAMLECANRKLTVRLSRDTLVSANQAVSGAARLSGFTIEGLTFYIADFSERSLLLRTGDRTLVVQ